MEGMKPQLHAPHAHDVSAPSTRPGSSHSASQGASRAFSPGVLHEHVISGRGRSPNGASADAHEDGVMHVENPLAHGASGGAKGAPHGQLHAPTPSRRADVVSRMLHAQRSGVAHAEAPHPMSVPTSEDVPPPPKANVHLMGLLGLESKLPSHCRNEDIGDDIVAAVLPLRARVLEVTPAPLACGCSRSHPARVAAIFTITSDWYRVLVLLTILSCVVLICAYDPTQRDSPRNQWSAAALIFINSAFTLELGLETLARGLYGSPSSYLSSPWRWLDACVVALGWFALVTPANDAFLGALRILRLLRACAFVTEVRFVIAAVANAVTRMHAVCSLVGLCVLVFALIGMNLWRGVLQGRCALVDASSNSTILLEELCGIACTDTRFACTTSFGDVCGDGQVCVRAANPDFGQTSFDNIGSALLTSFVFITTEGWTATVYALWHAWGNAWFVSLLSVAHVFITSWVVLELCLAIISASYARQQLVERSKHDKFTQLVLQRAHVRRTSSVQDVPSARSQVTSSTGVGAVALTVMQLLKAEHDRSAQSERSQPAQVTPAPPVTIHTNQLSIQQRAALSCLSCLSSNMSSRGHAASKRALDACFAWARTLRRVIPDTVLYNCSYVCCHPVMDCTTFFVLLANAVALCSERAGMDAATNAALQVLNAIFTAYLFVELCVQWFGIDELRLDRVSGWWIGYTVVIVASVADVAMTFTPCECLPTALTCTCELAGSAALMLRIVRVLRLLRLVNTTRGLRAAFADLARALPHALGAVILLVCIQLCAASMGMYLFGGAYVPAVERGDLDEVPRLNYDDLWTAFVAVFDVLDNENWNDALTLHMYLHGPAASLFFVGLVSLGTIIFLNIFIASIVAAFTRAQGSALRNDEASDVQTFGESLLLVAHWVTYSTCGIELDTVSSAVSSELSSPRTDVEMTALHTAAVQPHAFPPPAPLLPVPPPPTAFVSFRLHPITGRPSIVATLHSTGKNVIVDTNGFVRVYKRGATVVAQTAPLRRRTSMYSLQASVSADADNLSDIFEAPATHPGFAPIEDSNASAPSCFTRCDAFMRSSAVRYVSLAAIMLACVNLGLDQAAWHTSSSTQAYLSGAEYALTALFALEAFLQVMASIGSGRRRGTAAFDVLCALVSILCLGLLPTTGAVVRRSVLALRALRPLRLIPRVRTLKLVYASLLRTTCTSRMAYTTIMLLMIMFVLAFVGHVAFRGLFGVCNDEGITLQSACVGSFTATDDDCKFLPTRAAEAQCRASPDGAIVQLEWSSHGANFDDMGRAMLTLFELASGENWPTLMSYGTDGTRFGPLRKVNPPAMAFYVLVEMIINQFCIEVFCAAVIALYASMRTRSGGADALSANQRIWLSNVRVLLRTQPQAPLYAQRVGISMLDSLLYLLFTAATSRPLEVAGSILVLVHAGIMASVQATIRNDPATSEGLWDVEIIITLAFAAEAGMKFLGLGVRQCARSPSAMFDIAMAVGSSLSLFVREGSTGAVLRIFSVLRLFRLTRVWTPTYNLLRALALRASLFYGITVALALSLFVFTVAGMSLFGGIRRGAGSEYHNADANMDSFGVALFTLLRCATGENFNFLMHAFTIAPPYCDPAGADGDACGVPLAVSAIYWTVFYAFIAWILVSLLSAALLFAMDEVVGTSMGDLLTAKLTHARAAQFMAAWNSCIEPSQANEPAFLQLDQVARVLACVPPPLGTCTSAMSEAHVDACTVPAPSLEAHATAEKRLATMDIVPDDRGRLHASAVLYACYEHACRMAPLGATVRRISVQPSKISLSRRHLFKQSEQERDAPTLREMSMAQTIARAWRVFVARRKLARLQARSRGAAASRAVHAAPQLVRVDAIPDLDMPPAAPAIAAGQVSANPMRPPNIRVPK